MRMQNAEGQAVYYNVVEKHKKIRYQIQAASGQTITGRDKQKLKSRTFAQEHQAEAWLRRYDVESEWYFTCSDCACYDCPHKHDCEGQCGSEAPV